MMANIMRFGGGSVTPTEPPYPDGAIYWEGEEFVSKTGGWNGSANAGDSAFTVIGQLANSSNTINGSWSGSALRFVHKCTTNQIDLTNYTKLKFIFTASQSVNLGGTVFYIASSTSSLYGTYSARALFSGASYTDQAGEIDITALNSSYYVVATHQKWSGSTSSNNATLSIPRMWLE